MPYINQEQNIPLDLGPQYGTVSAEHSQELVQKLVAFLAYEFDEEAFQPMTCVSNTVASKAKLQMMVDRRNAAVQKAQYVIRSLIEALEGEFLLFYQSKFKQA